ncbi:MAG: LysR substrate-binding domain-containing protein [Gammaproteobacteria bacterium]
MTLTQLRDLIAITDSGLNITLAAAREHATQPGLSKQLRQLEAEIGCQLFTRHGKKLVAVTPAGRQVLERARRIVEETRNIRALAANLRAQTAGELRIATTHTQARFVLPEKIARFNRGHAGVHVHVYPGGDEQVVEFLESGKADLAITSTAIGMPQSGVSLPVYRWERVIAVPHAHPLSKEPGTPGLRELARYSLVSYESSLRENSSLRRAFMSAGLQPQFAMTAQDADLIKTYVREGLGVGILAEMAIRPEDYEDLSVLPAAGLFPICTTWVVLQPGRLLREYVLDFICLLAPQLERAAIECALDARSGPLQWPEAPRWPTAGVDPRAKRPRTRATRRADRH